eukprot:gene12725-6918_t
MEETIKLNIDTYIQLLKENARLKEHQIEILTRRITELEKYEKEKFDLIKNIETVENNAKYLKICQWFNSTDCEEIDKIIEKYSDNTKHNICTSLLTWFRDKWGYLTVSDFIFIFIMLVVMQHLPEELLINIHEYLKDKDRFKLLDAYNENMKDTHKTKLKSNEFYYECNKFEKYE